MAQVKVFYDQTGNTLTVWFGDPQEEHVCEETGDEVILMKDRAGRVIGLEKLNFGTEATEPLGLAFDVAASRAPEHDRTTALGSREREILRLIADGLENKEIAVKLRRAEGTIRNHVDHLMEKLGARTRAQAVAQGFRRGLLR